MPFRVGGVQAVGRAEVEGFSDVGVHCATARVQASGGLRVEGWKES